MICHLFEVHSCKLQLFGKNSGKCQEQCESSFSHLILDWWEWVASANSTLWACLYSQEKYGNQSLNKNLLNPSVTLVQSTLIFGFWTTKALNVTVCLLDTHIKRLARVIIYLCPDFILLRDKNVSCYIRTGYIIFLFLNQQGLDGNTLLPRHPN